MRRIELNSQMPDEAVAALGGKTLGLKDFDVLVSGEDATVVRPDGSPLLVYRASALPEASCRAAWLALRHAATRQGNRGMAAGKLPAKFRMGLRKTASISETRIYPAKADGTASNTSYSREVHSGIVGYFDRYQRIPYCRLTAFNLEKPERFRAALPFIRAVDRVFAENVPDRYAAQKSMIERTSPDFYIHGTAFTTITVNRNWQTAVHQDAGDYRPGFGVMAVLQAGEYQGGYLVFPKYRVAVDMRTGGVCMADVHEWHGNTPIVGKPGFYERISCVFYYREKMHRCGSAAEELEIAKNRKRGEWVWK